jgi:hypothetical protein
MLLPDLIDYAYDSGYYSNDAELALSDLHTRKIEQRNMTRDRILKILEEIRANL